MSECDGQRAKARLAVTTITRFRLHRRKTRRWDQRVHVLISRPRRSPLSYAGRKRGTASGYLRGSHTNRFIRRSSRARTRARATFLIRALPRKSGGTRHEIPLVIGRSYAYLNGGLPRICPFVLRPDVRCRSSIAESRRARGHSRAS